MRLKETVRALIVTAFFLNAGSVLAAETGKIEMQSRMWEEASAQATIKDSNAGTKEITISAENLAPDSVYTVWFVRESEGDRAAVGDNENSFRTDENGNGSFSATVPDEKIEEWDWIVVGFHPEGDPDNIENLHVAFTGDLKVAG